MGGLDIAPLRRRRGVRVPNRKAVETALLLASLFLGACASTARLTPPDVRLVDPNATVETKALVSNLKKIAPDHMLFGHQDDLAYGVKWKREKGRSDVKEVAGAFPSVYGWELGDLENGVDQNLDGVNFRDMQGWIREGYQRGGVITVSWHMDNPASGGSSWDTTRAVHLIVPGGEKHDLYRSWLDRFADFVRGTRVKRFLRPGVSVPIIFRPFHEHSGAWFWWGKGHVSPDEYVRLWRFTVEYLRDVKGLHNLIFAYSTDVFDSEEAYLEHYPGDDYVDLLGYDDYQALRTDEGVQVMTGRLRMLVRMAEERGKLAALTETGAFAIRDSTWWTGKLMKAFKDDPVARRALYALVWRNADERQYFAPFPGHPSGPDFVRFYEDPFVLFENELPNLYRWEP